MQKYISLSILLLFVTLSNVQANPGDTNNTDQKQNQTLSTPSKAREYTKITAALVGSALFGYAGLCMPFFLKSFSASNESKSYFIPSSLLLYPCRPIDSVVGKIAKIALSQSTAEEVHNKIGTKLPYIAAMSSLATSFALAKYGINKYRKLKNSNPK